MAKPEHFDIAIIGGGIAGISCAAAVSSQAKVLLLEAEGNFSEHATGRSAAYFAPSYGNEVIRQLESLADIAGSVTRIRVETLDEDA